MHYLKMEFSMEFILKNMKYFKLYFDINLIIISYYLTYLCFNISRNIFYCIQIRENPLKTKSLFTYEAEHKENFNGEINALSEDGKFNGIYSKEYEVFQIIF